MLKKKKLKLLGTLTTFGVGISTIVMPLTACGSSSDEYDSTFNHVQTDYNKFWSRKDFMISGNRTIPLPKANTILGNDIINKVIDLPKDNNGVTRVYKVLSIEEYNGIINVRLTFSYKDEKSKSINNIRIDGFKEKIDDTEWEPITY